MRILFFIAIFLVAFFPKAKAAYVPKTATQNDFYNLQLNNFTQIQSPNANFFSDIAYGVQSSTGYGTWCAVADEGSGSTSASMVSSTFGTSWLAGTTAANTRLLGVTFVETADKFVAVGVNGSNAYLLTSNSPMSCMVWASQTLPTPTTYSLRKAATNGITTVAVGEITVGNSCKAIYSTNLTTWTASTISGSECAGGLGGLYDVLWDGSKFVAVGPGKYATSTDGITWASGAMPTSTGYHSIDYNGKIYVSVDGSGSNSAFSTNGTTWTRQAQPMELYNVTWVGNYFMAGILNYIGANAAYSIDGKNWSPLKIFQYPSAIAYDGYQIIAIGPSTPNNMQIMRSIRVKF